VVFTYCEHPNAYLLESSDLICKRWRYRNFVQIHNFYIDIYSEWHMNFYFSIAFIMKMLRMTSVLSGIVNTVLSTQNAILFYLRELDFEKVQNRSQLRVRVIDEDHPLHHEVVHFIKANTFFIKHLVY
jgi:hypothetical protein